MNVLLVNLVLSNNHVRTDSKTKGQEGKRKRGWVRELTLIGDMVNISHFRTSSDTSRLSLFGTLERDPAVKESFSISLMSMFQKY